MSNSVEFTSFVPRTCRANSMTAALEAKAQAKVWHAMLAGVAGGEHLALDAAMAEAARHEDAGNAVERVVERFVAEAPRSRPSGCLTSTSCAHAGMAERFGHRQVRVRQLDVLANQGDLDDRLGRA